MLFSFKQKEFFVIKSTFIQHFLYSDILFPWWEQCEFKPLAPLEQSKSQRTNSLPAHNDTEIGYSMHTSKSFHNFPIFHKDSWVFFLQSYQQTCYAGRLVSPSRENCCPRCQDRLLCTAGSRFRPLWADDQHIHHLSRTDSQLHCIRRSFRTGLRWTFRKEKGLLANISFKFQGMQGTNCMLNDLCSVYVKSSFFIWKGEKRYSKTWTEKALLYHL